MYIRKRSIIIFIIMMILLPTDYLMGNLIIHDVVRSFQFLLFLYFLFIGLLNYKYVNRCIVVILCYYAYVYGYSYFVAHFGSNIWDAINGITLSIFFVHCYHHYLKDFLSAASKYYLFVAVFHIVLMIIIHNPTMYGAFGGKNYVGRFLIPGLMFILLNEFIVDGVAFNKKSIIQCGLIGAVILFSLSVTAIVGLLAFTGCIFAFCKFGINKMTSVFKFAIYSMVAFVLIYRFHIQDYFEFFIVRILHKDLSFTGRTEIWDAALRNVQNHPWFGVGIRDSMTAYLLNHAHSHQYWLHILLFGGIIAFVIVLLLYLIASKNLYRFRNSIDSIIISSMIISYLIMGIDEALVNAYFLLPLLVFAGTYRNSKDSVDYSLTP